VSPSPAKQVIVRHYGQAAQCAVARKGGCNQIICQYGTGMFPFMNFEVIEDLLWQKLDTHIFVFLKR
jgi:hypothetical protein